MKIKDCKNFHYFIQILEVHILAICKVFNLSSLSFLFFFFFFFFKQWFPAPVIVKGIQNNNQQLIALAADVLYSIPFLIFKKKFKKKKNHKNQLKLDSLHLTNP
jgi:endo-1,4-beta-D-glucanase Y